MSNSYITNHAKVVYLTHDNDLIELSLDQKLKFKDLIVKLMSMNQ